MGSDLVAAFLAPAFCALVFGIILFACGMVRSPWAALGYTQLFLALFFGLMSFRGWLGVIRGFSDAPGWGLLLAFGANVALGIAYLRRHATNEARFEAWRRGSTPSHPDKE